MAAITGLPNFFNAAAPDDADFNNASKAILDQLGGTYWSEAGGAYVEVPGNIDGTNLSNPAFRNSQKAEPYSTFILTSACQNFTTGNYFAGMVPFPPFVTPTLVESVQMGVRSDRYKSGSFILYVNGINMGNFKPVNNVLANTDTMMVPLGIVCNPGDWIIIDGNGPLTDPFTYNTGGSFSASLTSPAIWTLYCRTKHVRG
ncbi:MAG TPA: hypothetical protein VIV60_12265 [Polyangiaceae bacterium]